MRTGRLDRRIILQRKTVTVDGSGAEIYTWVDLATIWAIYIPSRGAERFLAMQKVAEIDTIFRIRHRNDVTAKDRISYRGKLYDIQAIVDLCGRDRALEIYTKERDA